MVHLDYRDARPIYLQIIDGIREQIASGVLRSGEKLPSVRELAAALAINPNTIQRSYRQLEADGWISTVPGKGCFVTAQVDPIAQEQARWYKRFDEASAALLSLGVTRESLQLRLQEGGKTNA